jgi:tetratricopeptide (TPR) repeat protein
MVESPPPPAPAPKPASKPAAPKPAPAPAEPEPYITTTPVGASLHATTTVAMGISAESLTKRGFMLLEDGDWKKAADKFDSALDIDPEFARAYVGLLCIELKITSEMNLVNQSKPLAELANFKKAIRYASPEYRVTLETYNQLISHRITEQNQNAELEKQKQEQHKQDEKRRKATEEQNKILEEQQRKAEERARAEEEQKRLYEAEANLSPEEKAERRRVEIKRREEEQERLNAGEQEFRRKQKEWMKKGLCYYCGGKMTLLKKCKECGKSSLSSF